MFEPVSGEDQKDVKQQCVGSALHDQKDVFRSNATTIDVRAGELVNGMG